MAAPQQTVCVKGFPQMLPLCSSRPEPIGAPEVASQYIYQAATKLVKRRSEDCVIFQ